MSGKRVSAMLVFAAVAALSVAPARAGTDRDRNPERGGSVVPCSLDGVNPGYHPQIFGNPATARAYGFVQAQDGSWHVSCGSSGFQARADSHERPPHPRSHKTSKPQ